jgi:hypothetical protein
VSQASARSKQGEARQPRPEVRDTLTSARAFETPFSGQPGDLSSRKALPAVTVLRHGRESPGRPAGSPVRSRSGAGYGLVAEPPPSSLKNSDAPWHDWSRDGWPRQPRPAVSAPVLRAPGAVRGIDSSLIYEVLKDVQTRLASLEGMREEMREGFASLRAHMATQHGDAVFLERRVIELERDRSGSNAACSSPTRPTRLDAHSAGVGRKGSSQTPFLLASSSF